MRRVVLLACLLPALVWGQGVNRTPNLRLPFTNTEKVNEGLSRIDEVLGPITGGVYSTDNRGKVFDSGGAVFNIMAPNFGAVCDNSTDDRVAIQKAIDTAETVGGTVLIPNGTCYVSDTLTIGASNVSLRGEGNGSILRFPSSVGAYITASSLSGLTVADLRIEGGGTGTGAFGSCVEFNTVTDSTIRNVTCYNPDDFGFYAIDSDRILIEGNRVIGADARFVYGTQQPYCVLLDGTGSSTVRGNTCYQVLFGMLAQSANSSDTVSARTAAQARGNTFTGNTIDKMYSHAFSLNGIDGQTVVGNVVRNYPLDGDSPRAAYQVKSTTPIGAVDDDRAAGNVIAGNVAETVDTCYGTNDGSRTTWTGNTCRDARYDGFWANGSIRDVVRGLYVYGFNSLDGSRACVRTEAAAAVNVSGVKCEPDSGGTSTAVGIDVRSSSVNGIYDDVDLVGTFATCISISTGSNNTVLKSGVRLNAATCTTAIDDDVTNTLYPRSYSMEMNAADSGLHLVAHPLRGLIVGRVRLITTTATGGGGNANVSVGQNGSTSKILASTALSTSAGTIASYDANTSPALSARDITAGTMIQANITHTGTVSSGRIGVVVDGLDGPPNS